MAIYHCTFKMIKRSEGKSAVAAAAYRSGEKMENIYDGVTHDYTRKGWVVYKEILLPPQAPPEWADRSTLWNAVELSADHPRDRLARECTIALPRAELTLDQQIDLTREFVQRAFVSLGMCADVCIHNPPQRDDLGRPLDANGYVTSDPEKMIFINPHAHILLTCRPLSPDGTWEKKSSTRYICRRGTEERHLSGTEYKKLKAEGWEKQYRYYFDGDRIWLTPSEAETKGLKPEDRVFKGALQTHKNSGNPTMQYWDSKEFVKDTRKIWADCVNKALERAGFDTRVDHRSYADQGLDKVPTEHLGPGAKYADRRWERTGKGERTEKGIINDMIREYNRLSDDYIKASGEIHHQLHETAYQLGQIRTDAVVSSAADAALGLSDLALDTQRRELDAMELVEREIQIVGSLNASALHTINALLSGISAVGGILSVGAKATMDRIEKLRQEISTRDAYAKDQLARCDCTDVDELRTKITQLRYDVVREQQKRNDIEQRSKNVQSMDDLMREYQQIISTIPPGLRADLEEEQNLVDYELEERHPEALADPEVYEKALARVDERIAEIKAQGDGEEEERVAEMGRSR